MSVGDVGEAGIVLPNNRLRFDGVGCGDVTDEEYARRLAVGESTSDGVAGTPKGTSWSAPEVLLDCDPSVFDDPNKG